MPRSLSVVFVHGWSVTHTNTYGGLPERLAAEAEHYDLSLSVRQIWLGEYVSFHDEVRLEDVSRAVEAAVRRDLADLLEAGERFAAVTHSTGGPVMRDWVERFYGVAGRAGARETCPMSHLVMLAPANFGSALAQLGKSRISRIKSWFGGVEPGQGVLDWLELGSPEAWKLNAAWIAQGKQPLAGSVNAFVLTGQTIDRKLFDALNSYTGELGSDGVVRAAAANLNATYVLLEQESEARGKGPNELVARRPKHAPRTAFRLVKGAAHSGSDKGIMRSVGKRAGADGSEVVDAILRCCAVAPQDGAARPGADYVALCDAFAAETEAVHAAERVEKEDRLFLRDRIFVHDRMTQVIFRVRDSQGHPISDFDLLLIGQDDDPNHLPKGFFIDRQRNQRARNTLTYFLNHDVMAGCPAVVVDGEVERPEEAGMDELGLWIKPRPTDGFVHYGEARLRAGKELAEAVLRADETVLVDIVLRRIVREGVVHLSRGTKRGSFRKVKPGAPLPDER